LHSQKLNGDLVAVETPKENNFIKNVLDITDSDMPNSVNHWVLGGKRRDNIREYIWVQTGKPVVWGDWNVGEPDYSSKSYIYMNTRYNNRKWDDWTGSAYNIICEAKGKI
jgi:hypothetical protein